MPADSEKKLSLPQGWTEVKLKDLGFTKAESINPANEPDERFELWSVPSYPTEEPEYQLGKDIGSNKIKVKPDDVLLCKINPRINRVWKVGEKKKNKQIASTEWIVFRTKKINSDFFRYRLMEPSVRKEICANVSGVGGSLTRARPQIVKDIQVTIAPLNEQKRIAAKIEALHAKSKKAKEALETAKPLLDKLRQSILASAFRGDLTADWRKKNPDVQSASVLLEHIRVERREKWEENELAKMKAKGKEPTDDKWKSKYKEPEPVDINGLLELPKGWCWASTAQIAEQALGKMLDRNKHVEGMALPYIRNINVRWGFCDTSDLFSMFFKENEIERYSIGYEDILICEGGEPGRSAVWEQQGSQIMYQKAIHRVRPYCKIPPWWFVYHLWNDSGKGILKEYFTGTTIKHFTGKSLSKYAICIAPLEEQKEIVLRIKMLMASVENLQDKIKKSEEKMTILDQSILSKAFQGELVSQDPTEESVSVTIIEKIKAAQKQ